jgi:hypothetical protein
MPASTDIIQHNVKAYVKARLLSWRAFAPAPVQTLASTWRLQLQFVELFVQLPFRKLGDAERGTCAGESIKN